MDTKRITKFEKARIIGTRANLISMGSKPLIDMSKFNSDDPIKIAMEELRQNKLPMIIIREFPNGDKEKLSLFK
jgi:DNA-directed RNA polymerase subunit K/omega